MRGKGQGRASSTSTGMISQQVFSAVSLRVPAESQEESDVQRSSDLEDDKKVKVRFWPWREPVFR